MLLEGKLFRVKQIKLRISCLNDQNYILKSFVIMSEIELIGVPLGEFLQRELAQDKK